ncbi:MAG: sialate O-acetylesterase [Verrucomicrobiales bacterium]|nr:sialate O-acetylesterase [Verrucomicrobiales bacterium]
MASVTVSLITSLACAAAARDLTVGAAKSDITPSTNVLNWVGHKPYPGVLDPVYVRSMVISDGVSRVALVAWDLTDTREGFVARVRREISAATQIPSECILINASHTHSAPWVPAEGDPLLEAERRTLLPVQNGPGYRDWADRLIRRTVETVRQADSRRQPVSLAIARAWAGDVVFNRRPVREDGKVETTYEPATPYSLPKGQRFGPMDPTLSLVGFLNAQGGAVATLFSLACHPVSIYPHDSRVSADWPGPVSQRLSETLGGEAAFLQGCAGDIVPIRRNLPSRDRMAELIGDRALAAWTNRSLLPATGPLRSKTARITLPLTAKARQDLGRATLDTEVQVITLGSLAFVGLPGEPLTAISLEIQRRSPFPHTVVLGYSNGGGVQYVGAAGDKPKGGYEMTEAGSGEDRCGQILIDTVTQLLQAIRVDDVLEETAAKDLHVYLLAGQSNMAGRGPVEPPDQVPHPRVLTLGTNGLWRLALDPLHQDRANAGVGLGSSFGRTLADSNPRIVIGLVPVAVGGSPLSRWVKGGDLHRQSVDQARVAMSKGTLKGILWHQGENDSDGAVNAESYAARLAQMIQDIRTELGVPDLPFVAGKLGQFLITDPRSDTPLAGTINAQLQSLVGRVPGFKLVESEHLTAMPDRIHFDTPSLREFGRRYAEAFNADNRP